MPFFIVGLPRSRTYWLSKALTQPGVFCHHEAIALCSSKEEYLEFMGNSKFVGDSDSALLLTDFQNWFPGSKTIVIERDPEEVKKSLYALYGEHPEIDTLLITLTRNLRKVEGLRVAFKDIDSRLDTISNYLDLGLDIGHMKDLTQHNLQQPNLDGNPDHWVYGGGQWLG